MVQTTDYGIKGTHFPGNIHEWGAEQMRLDVAEEYGSPCQVCGLSSVDKIRWLEYAIATVLL